MNIRFLLSCIAVVLCCAGKVSAQPQQGRQPLGNDFWEKRNAFIVAEIKLTADEAAKFIPMENEFKQKTFEIGRECRTLTRENQDNNKMSDAEYLKLIDCWCDTRLKEAQLEKEYFDKFKKILKPEKIYKYREADARFQRELINTVRRSPAVQERNRNQQNNTNRQRNTR